MATPTLQYPIDGDDSQIAVANIDANIAAMIAANGHAFFTLYDAAAEEQVLVTGYRAPYFLLQREEDAGFWPAGTFVRVEEVSPQQLPKSIESQFKEFLFQIQGGPGLLRTQPDPLVIKFDLPATGVTPGNYGGMQIDVYGRITSIPANWPQNALPVFSPGDSDGGGGGAPTAANLVSYTPQAGASIALGGNVQTVIQQLEDAAALLQSEVGSPVTSIAAGSGIVLTGPSTTPIIGMTLTGITPGTYNGFTIDATGRISSYTTPASLIPTFAGTAPISAVYDSPTNKWTIAAAAATTAAFGTVKITDVAQIAANTVADPTTIPNFTGVVAAIGYYTAPLAAAFTDIVPGDKFSFYDLSAAKIVTATIADLFAAFTSGVVTVTATVATLVHGVRITSASRTGAGVLRITLSTAMANANYHVSITNGGTGAGLVTSVNIISATVFDIYFKDVAGVATDPTAFTFKVVQA